MDRRGSITIEWDALKERRTSILDLDTWKERRDCIPVIYARGTHYDVGHDVGRVFRSLIQSRIERHYKNDPEIIEMYESEQGKQVYEDTLDLVKREMPGYLEELQGISSGSRVPFHKLFLLHVDLIMFETSGIVPSWRNTDNEHCSCVIVNNEQETIIGHNEDGGRPLLDHLIIINAHIIPEPHKTHWSYREEEFTSLTYAGELPGYCMGFTRNGFSYSINTLISNKMVAGKMPARFLNRAMQSCKSIAEVEQLLLEDRFGAGEGVSINIIELNAPYKSANIEVAPCIPPQQRSRVRTTVIESGSHLVHCNTYLRFEDESIMDYLTCRSTMCRLETLTEKKKSLKMKSKADIVQLLGDTSHARFKVFRDQPPEKDANVTLLVGILDCRRSTWSLYTRNPQESEPVAVLHVS